MSRIAERKFFGSGSQKVIGFSLKARSLIGMSEKSRRMQLWALLKPRFQAGKAERSDCSQYRCEGPRRRPLVVEIQTGADDLIGKIGRSVSLYEHSRDRRIQASKVQIKEYSTFQVHRGSHATPSTPAPAVHPTFTSELENVAGAPRAGMLVPEIDTLPYARPPVASSKMRRSKTYPNRPRTVPNHSIFVW